MDLLHTLEAWTERRELKRELAHVSREEIEDFGLSRAEFEALALMPAEQVARLEEMARINGLDPARLREDRALNIAVGLTCAQCGEQRHCREALADGAFRAETDFCPNAGTYRMLAAE